MKRHLSINQSCRSRHRAWLNLLFLAMVMVVLSGCLVGPDYQGPPQIATTSITAPQFQRSPSAEVVPTPPPARWWDAVSDPLLAQLVDQALADSVTLNAALARIRSARAQQRVNTTQLLPSGGATAGYARARIPTQQLVQNGTGTGQAGALTALPDPLKANLYNAGFDASWELDLFGATHRSIESAAAMVLSQEAAYEDAQVQLASDVARAYTLLRESQHRVELTQLKIRLRSQAIVLVEQRRAAGTASELELQQLKDPSAQDAASLPDLQIQVDQQLDQIAILLGREPGSLDRLLVNGSGQQQPLPADVVPEGTPADWLQRRPDIRRSERVLAARNAAIGQNVAAYFPQVRLLGLLSASNSKFDDLFTGSPLSLVTPTLSWNFLSIPNTRAKVKGAEADRDEASEDYKRSVLQALQDANDSLSRFGQKRNELLQRVNAQTAAARASALTQARYAGGTASLVDDLDAQREVVSNDDKLAQARSEYMQAYISLQKSLGLGWDSAHEDQR